MSTSHYHQSQLDLMDTERFFSLIQKSLDERSRRLVAAAIAESGGRTNLCYVTRCANVSRPVIYSGLGDLHDASPNLVKNMKTDRPDQALCSDITYIYTEEGFLFLSLTMDMCVRDIVGWAVCDSLKTGVPLKALSMVAKTVGDVAGVVAHSDRGCQYASHACRELLDALGWKSSTTEELRCYENAMDERLNGILKGEYFLDRHFKTPAGFRADRL